MEVSNLRRCHSIFKQVRGEQVDHDVSRDTYTICLPDASFFGLHAHLTSGPQLKCESLTRTHEAVQLENMKDITHKDMRIIYELKKGRPDDLSDKVPGFGQLSALQNE